MYFISSGVIAKSVGEYARIPVDYHVNYMDYQVDFMDFVTLLHVHILSWGVVKHSFVHSCSHTAQ